MNAVPARPRTIADAAVGIDLLKLALLAALTGAAAGIALIAVVFGIVSLG